MKKQGLFFFFLLISGLLNAQIMQLVSVDSGSYLKLRLESQDADSAYYTQTSSFKKDNVPLSIAKQDIIETQTLGVRFLDDEYDDFLSGNNRKLEFADLAKHSDFGVFVSGRKISGEIALLIKIKIKARSDFSSNLHIHEGDMITFRLSSGEQFQQSFQGCYMLHGMILYNFGYIILSDEALKKLSTNNISYIELLDRRCKMEDPYAVMRHLYALLETELFSFE